MFFNLIQLFLTSLKKLKLLSSKNMFCFMFFILLLSLLSITYAAIDTYTMEVTVVYTVKFLKYDSSTLIKNLCELVFWKGTNMFPSAVTIDEIATYCPFFFEKTGYKDKNMTDDKLFREKMKNMNLL